MSGMLASFDTEEKRRNLFFDSLRDGMEVEIAELESLPLEATEDWIQIASPALFALKLIPFGPMISRKPGNSPDGLFPVLDDRIAQFDMMCWPQLLRLSLLGLWKAIKQDTRD
jgi:hypothetical protein